MSDVVSSIIGADAAKSAASTSAKAQVKAGREAAIAAAFRPVGISTLYGTSNFTTTIDPKTGLPTVTAAGYTASPEIQALQQRLAALYGQNLGLAEMAQPAAAGLFNLGAGYLSESPEAARQRIFDQLQAARLPAQIQEENRLAATAFGRGRTGVSISGIGQPELYALARAREAQRAADIYDAEKQAQQQISFGTGLMGTGLKLPTTALGGFQTAFGTQADLEKLAMQPLELGANLGGRNVNTTGANALLQAGLGAAQTQYGANLAQIAGLQSATKPLGSLADQYLKSLFPSTSYSGTGLGYDASGMNPYAYTPQAATWNDMFGGTGGMGD